MQITIKAQLIKVGDEYKYACPICGTILEEIDFELGSCRRCGVSITK